ncbi:lysophospholipid acyltransferase family protein [Pigmentibacter sp. JX0631]|uniref:lysophospholipid acyltransferase family protein n=1 Tax=Pigmentibacter sp. JX0631 TaxID=2976982 RepID=UPI002469BCC8|nr:lysophospholipid acyltransferase family protein [Pigmentibacter sp. JX0631]WGL58739.1 lysophospholipid acyltransferase family protein [Pigmentibacter sp. JX0631]
MIAKLTNFFTIHGNLGIKVMTFAQKNSISSSKDHFQLLRAIYTWLNVVFLSILFASLVLIFFPIVYFFDRERHSLHWIATKWALSIGKFNPWWKFEVRGKEKLATIGEPVIYVSNHQSQADILALFMLSTRFRWLAKASLFKIPIFGWALSAVGYVPVIRTSKTSGEKSIKLSSSHLKRGTPMLFFPEGTRSKTGELGEFKSGAFRLAKMLNVSIIPITISGCSDLLPKGSLCPKYSRVIIHVHEKIDPTNLTATELMEKSKIAISSKL